MTTSLEIQGISASLPQGWEGRAMQRSAEPVPRRADRVASSVAAEQTHPVVHLANFALPPDRGDYGSGAVDVMGRNHALVVLVEFGSECVGTALFAPSGLPTRLHPTWFGPNALQRRLPGQLGFQRFFTERHRAFCLYVVLGGRRQARVLCDACTEVVRGVEIEAR